MDEFNKPACPTEVDRMKGYLTTAAAHRISSYSKSTTDSPLTTNGSFRAGSWESVSLIYDPVAHSEMPNMAVFKETTILSCRCRCRHTNPPSELNWVGGHCCYLIDMKFFSLCPHQGFMVDDKSEGGSSAHVVCVNNVVSVQVCFASSCHNNIKA